MKKVLLLSLALMLSIIAVAQEKITEGVITSKQTLTSDNEQVQAQLEAMGDMNSVTYFKGSKSRAEVSNPMSGDVTVISDSETFTTLTLMDNAMGKMYMTQTTEITDEILEGITVEDGTGTKTILGYECKEQIITMTQQGVEVKMSMFVTDEIAPILTKETMMLGEKIKGFPMYMEMSMNQAGMNMVITTEVTKLDKTPVSDDKFDMTPPEGYKEMPGM